MAVIHGSSGLAVLPAPYETGLNIFAWTANIVNDEFPADLFVDANDPGALGHMFYYGMYQLRGKIRAFLDDTTPLDISQIAPGRAAVAAMTLTARQGSTTDQALVFTGHLNNFAIVVNKQGGLNAVEADMISTTAVTVTNYS